MQFVLLCGLCLFPVFPRGLHSVIMIIMGIITISYLFLEGASNWNHRKSIQLVIFGAIFFLLLISVSYSSDYKIGFRYIIRSFPLILIPMVFLSGKTTILNNYRLLVLLKIYISAVLLRLLIVHFVVWDDLYNGDFVFLNIRSRIEEFTDIHGTYLSMWTGFAILIIIYLMRKNAQKIWHFFLGMITIFYLVYWQLIIGSRMAFFATLVCAVFLILRSFNITVIKIGILFFFLLIGGYLIFQKQFSSKIEQLRNYETAIPPGKYENTYPQISNENIRSVVYYCSGKKIIENPIFGIGIGDVDKKLQECYDTEFNHSDTFRVFFFNSHSQYLLILLASGLIGFLIYLFSCFVIIKWSLVKSELYVSFLILIFFCFLFENILSRHDGVLMYTLFNSVLFFVEKKN